jgi:hypothetical protein
MARADLTLNSIPVHGLSLDLITFSAMSYFAAEMNIPLNEAIAVALKEWLTESNIENWPAGIQFDANAIQN